MRMDSFIDNNCDELIRRVDRKHAPIFMGYMLEQQRAIYRYLFSRRPSNETPSLKSRFIGLYDPWADRAALFQDGLRFCLNDYVGCAHDCGYCYVNCYSQSEVGINPHAKDSFEKKVTGDLKDLSSLGLPTAPLHLSNSTDPFQERLERQYHHALFALEEIRKNRRLFSSIVLLTKNPAILCEEPYISIVSDRGMQPLTVQISCAFWRDEARIFYERNATSVESRLNSIRRLTESGVDVELRIDPLFPSGRIDEKLRRHMPLPCYAIPEAQTEDDLIKLVRFAKAAGVSGVVAKPLKVAISKRAQRCKDWFANLYTDAGEGRRTASGGSWRLPREYQGALTQSLADICTAEGMTFRHCKHDVLCRK